MDDSPHEVSHLLLNLNQGDQAAFADLLPLVYDELHSLAKAYMSREQPGHTLQTTALLNEAYLRLAQQEDKRWQKPRALLRRGRDGHAPRAGRPCSRPPTPTPKTNAHATVLPSD